MDYMNDDCAFWIDQYSEYIYASDDLSTTLMEKFLVVYFDDIFIYSHSRKQHLDHLYQVCIMLRKEELYATPRSVPFLQYKFTFYVFVIFANGVSAYPEKMRAIEECPELKTIREVRSFHGLVTFYWRFIKGFNTVMIPITDCLKKGEFAWSNAAAKAFVEIKTRMVSASVIYLPDFSKIFEVAYDAFGIGIWGVLAQEGHPVTYFSEKLNDAKQKYSIYDYKKFYAVIQVFRYLRHYLLLQEFIHFSDHEALKWI